MPKRYKIPANVAEQFSEETVKRISRMESIHSVVGVLFLQKGIAAMYTVPESIAAVLNKKLPALNTAMSNALTEIDIQNELVAYRIETKHMEIMVATGQGFAAVVVHKIKKKKRAKVENN